jgi:hypothetical protein
MNQRAASLGGFHASGKKWLRHHGRRANEFLAMVTYSAGSRRLRARAWPERQERYRTVALSLPPKIKRMVQWLDWRVDIDLPDALQKLAGLIAADS